MKKILGLAIGAILIIGLVAGGTWAYFQDTETSSANNITAGTLDLKLNTADANVNIIAALTDKKPGDSDKAPGPFAALSNAGNLAGKLSIVTSNVMNAESTGTGEFINDSSPAASVSGTATGGTTATLIDTGASWGVNAYAGYAVVTSGAGAVGTSYVVSNTATTLTVSPAFSGSPSGTTSYRISKGELGAKIKIAPWVDLNSDGIFDATDIGLGSTGTYTGTTTLVWETVDSFSSKTYSNVIASFVTANPARIYVPWDFVNAGDASDNVAQGDAFTFGITFTLDQ